MVTESHAKDSSYRDFNGSECSISFITNGANRSTTISGNKLVGAGVPGEGTHFRDSHITMHRFNLVLPVGGAKDPITSVTAQSYNQGSFIEKERHRWGEQVAATIFTQQLITARPNINPQWWSHQVR
jgi:hypothetical protein